MVSSFNIKIKNKKTTLAFNRRIGINLNRKTEFQYCFSLYSYCDCALGGIIRNLRNRKGPNNGGWYSEGSAPRKRADFRALTPDAPAASNSHSHTSVA